MNETSQIPAFSTGVFPLFARSAQRDDLRRIEGDESRAIEVCDLTDHPDTQAVILVILAFQLERGITA